jgi:5-methylcytosine-specific restriction endonuclease McrA
MCVSDNHCIYCFRKFETGTKYRRCKKRRYRNFCNKCILSFASTVRRANQRAKNAKTFGRLHLPQWVDVLMAHNFSCAECDSRNNLRTNNTLTLDHILPLSKGGMNLTFNIQPLCVTCHKLKDHQRPKGHLGSLFREQFVLYNIAS